MSDLTRQITDWVLAEKAHTDNVSSRLFAALYDEIHGLARRQLRRHGRPGETLNTTALVHEAYLKLVDQSRVELHDRAHFFSLAARVMRQIIVDCARRHLALKRGGDQHRVATADNALSCDSEVESLIALDEALNALAEIDERLVRVVECRYFAGLSERESAEALGISVRTLQRAWVRAQGWLRAGLV